MGLRSSRRRKSSAEAKLNITSMMDMFTIILVFLLKNFSTQGQLVTPAKGLNMPISTIDSSAVQALDVEISVNHRDPKTRKVEKGKINVEGKTVVYLDEIKKQEGFLIPTLKDVLDKYYEEAEKAATMFGQEFKGQINIQGDTAMVYDVLTKVMYTCGQSGFPNMKLVVYRKE
ncbi:MAG: hypothetical protein A2268_04170 [Candidatus Raymondbacteria bacterium RifOxyA12_full_50_37]|uniref:Biopolymer transporter ExbD n=1 Tax=Candidatus Raymondbacteria bacterium RIFOXYD12_FULL_49_13 TaxID=1817890 RepID=A0A1F7FBP0_UNCRA|nr:MAG: hypothetical protein A2268_04170 [Candidatus Raymondbacteria bacterium RifOxyA12_full_50_37]OGJ92580.1 MAG: hypothetical protein A2248_05780 [Candidatus Raymondbacteria bacterium RIFOXYA2_FULL_49_16]OGJ92858.1 MAG: hypothetical protein A2350_16790 [Candidatus Raymondbacteria bacterium RifOxyB12_full_50_8]OGJ97934.1 MAG: hypothetical protein A2453_02805 [Candidatus Raymondbacteria bacterium RIFOXYC2_FULL_50_21]OGK03952.1 MAG: hypothetical protein A2519_04480 [Candidatus Raymondbacteria b